ncbi:MAG: hypothetical protein AUJ96_05825 [Armatimonadetes bacterium CG2_30_66_41]|jgi:putative transcriptional regulator|nr:helix-turn-helix domain-containing protein [Armatimonadota bacterium]OIP08703.1 MAG: hypothetical protein AUJ96_05825 [Armatimonadetes bacterium CG2_30_66_41]NCO91677.1 helix-turn-helix domain-containing protein [Armatimonadota bacterium]NCP29780.1 helix-turn-helix domain-containing protein [Armatimonadota bacterium]NCQ32964.1 helix-turn-helix domain-containing protein [Armatimonadota bacterium]
MPSDAFNELAEALAEGVEALRGGAPLVRRRVEVADPKRYGRSEIRSVRRRLGATQAVFAEVLGVSPRTVQAWEQGQKKPSSLACRMLQVVEERPEVAGQWVSVET